MSRGRFSKRWVDAAAVVSTLVGLTMLLSWAARAGRWAHHEVVGQAIHDSLGVHVQQYHTPRGKP